jgi:energy-converting hydrogenase Eha subunit A
VAVVVEVAAVERLATVEPEQPIKDMQEATARHPCPVVVVALAP